MDKKCFNCGREIEKNFIFCPYCGANIKREEDKRNYGFLGRDDEIDNLNINNSVFGSLFNNIVNELTRQMSNSNPEQFGRGIRINVNSLNGKPVIKVNELRNKNEMKIDNGITDEEIGKMRKLPKKEAETSVRRLSNRLIYEIHLPGVKSMKNIMINKLESGIEIRAFSDDASYFKILPINLPIVNYGFEKSKLTIELNPKA